jgi:hypothetical protein
VKGARRFLTESGAKDAQPTAPASAPAPAPAPIAPTTAFDFRALQAVRDRLASALAAA